MRSTATGIKGDLIHCTAAERTAITETIQRALAEQPDVIFGYVYGSFAQDRPFHDIDVAVYLDTKDTWRAALNLADKLEKRLNKDTRAGHTPVDVRVLNNAPARFLYHVLLGKIVHCRNETLRIRLVEQTVRHYLDIKPLRLQALKKAMTA